ncbi:MAG: F0F1 ATP synthase subunit B [Puniceicoccales bacterium]|jgi:F-type H+-transporting ATPase subunit b|nr:F0F1 ATP synthase subunit B [Puniceicoccales bacterium]
MLFPSNLVIASAEAGGTIERFGIEPVYIAWQFASFAILAVVLYYFGIKPILATMDSRNNKIEEGLRFSDEMKDKLAEADKQYEARLVAASDEAAKMAREAHDRAKVFEEKASQEAIAKANDILRRAEDQLERDRAQMLAQLRAEVARLVVETTGKVLSRELSADEKSRFNDSATREIASKN